MEQKYTNNKTQYGLPELATLETVTIKLPTAKGTPGEATVPNPMYKFTNPAKDSKAAPAAMGDKKIMKDMAIGNIDGSLDDFGSVYPVCPTLPTMFRNDIALWAALLLDERHREL